MKDPLIEKYGTSRNGHSIFAPSASASWLNCSGSLLVNARAGDTAGYEAAEGTVAHSVSEHWSKTGKRPDFMLGKMYQAKAGGNEYDIEVTSDMLYHVERYVDWCAEVPGDHFFEQRVDLSAVMPIPNQGGTADHFACEPFKLTITDLKYGTGVRVYAKGNTQALLYAAGVFMAWDLIYGFETIVIRICQPRLNVFETWEITRAELLEFIEYVRIRAREAWVENAPRTPSPKACRWCAGYERCPAVAQSMDDMIDEMFEVEDDEIEVSEVTSKTYDAEQLQSPTQAVASLGRAAARIASRPVPDMSNEALAYALTFRSYFETWFKKIADILLDRVERGQKVPFFELSEGRRIRRWKDPQIAASYIVDHFDYSSDEALYVRKLLSVAKMEKLLRKAEKMKPKEIAETLADLVNTVQSKRSLVLIGGEDRPDADELTDDFDTEDDEDADE